MSATDFSPLSSQARNLGRIPEDRQAMVGLLPNRPRGFHGIRGTPSLVRFGGTVPRPGGGSAAKRMGLAYEQRIHDVLSAIYGRDYRPHPSMLYEDRGGLRRAIPDGLLWIAPRFVLVEIKYSHCELAWWQLNRLYLPLLTKILHAPVECVEVCRLYDPSVTFPPHAVIESLHRVPRGVTGVLQWRI